MPINLAQYHPKWSLISRLIRYKRAGNRCEWCAIENGKIVKRTGQGEWRSLTGPEWETLYEYSRVKAVGVTRALVHYKFTKVILCVAHIDRDRNNNRFSNLAALCQRCHLEHDMQQHIANRKYGIEHTGEQQGKLF